MVIATVMYMITTQEHGVDTTMKTFIHSVGIRIVSMMNYHMKVYTKRKIYYERIR